MPDTGTQLRTYFDSVVERVTEDDVRIRASTERGIPVRHRRLSLRPRTAAALAFWAAIALIGGVGLASAIIGSEMREAGAGGNAGGATAADSISSWVGPVLIGGIGLLALGVWSMRRRARVVRQRGEEDMQTIERPELAHEQSGTMTRLRNRSRLLAWLSGLLAVAVVALGAWLVFAPSGEATLPAGAQAALDDYTASWNTLDGDAYQAAVAPDYRFVNGVEVLTAQAQASRFDLVNSFQVTTEDQVVAGDGPYYVAQRETIRTAGVDHVGMSTYVIREYQDGWKVMLHTWVGDL